MIFDLLKKQLFFYDPGYFIFFFREKHVPDSKKFARFKK